MTRKLLASVATMMATAGRTAPTRITASSMVMYFVWRTLSLPS
jgi:hypothetical protein